VSPPLKRWLPFVPAGILALVAVAQRALLLTTALTPWMGGGFSMFTTVDGINARHLRVFVATTGSDIAISAPVVPDSLLNFPTTSALDDIARKTLAGDPALTHVRAEVWSFRFDRANGKAIAFPVRAGEARR
jgi:hypothetical protein